MTLRLRMKSATWEAPNVVSYDLRPLEAGELPPFIAGAHMPLDPRLAALADSPNHINFFLR